jgi:hypothetical protein
MITITKGNFNNPNLANDSKTPANTGYCARETVPME